MLVRHYVDEYRSAAMLAGKKSVGVTPEVNLKECTSCMPLPTVNKAAHSGFEIHSRHHQKGVLVTPQKDMCLPNILFFKKWTKKLWKVPMQNSDHQSDAGHVDI